MRDDSWQNDLPTGKIGLVALGGTGFKAEFSDLRVFTLK